MHSFQQMQLHLAMLVLVLAVVQSTWTMLAALAVRLDSLTVPEALLSTVTEATQKMLEFDVKVCFGFSEYCNENTCK